MQLIEVFMPKVETYIFVKLKISTSHFGKKEKNSWSVFFLMTSFPRWPPVLGCMILILVLRQTYKCELCSIPFLGMINTCFASL